MSKNIEFETEVFYPVPLVWQSLTKKEALSQWIMLTNFKPEVGHHFRFTSKPNKFWRGYTECQVIEIVPEKILKFIWQTAEGQDPTLITYELIPTAAGTKIKVIHSGFNRSHGWFSGLFFRTMIKAGMKKEFTQWLPQVLENGKNGDFGKVIRK